MKKLITMAAMALALSGGTALAADSGGIWLEGNYDPGHGAERNGTGGGLGVRSEYWGMRLSVIDNIEFDNNRISVLPLTYATLLGHETTNLGYKNINYEYGFDFDLYWNLTSVVSLFAGPGIYYQQRQEIITDNDSDSTMVFGGKKKTDIIPAASGGMQLRIPFGSDGGGRLLLSIGYHSEKGISGGLGGYW